MAVNINYQMKVLLLAIMVTHVAALSWMPVEPEMLNEVDEHCHRVLASSTQRQPRKIKGSNDRKGNQKSRRMKGTNTKTTTKGTTTATIKTTTKTKGKKNKTNGTFLSPVACPGGCFQDPEDGTAPDILPCDGNVATQQWEIVDIPGSSPPLFQLKNSASQDCLGIGFCDSAITSMLPCTIDEEVDPLTELTMVGGTTLLNWGCWLEGRDLYLNAAGIDETCLFADKWDDDEYLEGALFFLTEINFRI